MKQCKQAADLKSMLFVQLIGDQPVHALIEELKHEKPFLFEKVLPVLGGFHTACAFLATIYRRFIESGLVDIAISAGIVEADSAEAALKGKRCKRGMRISKLIYEALLRLMIDELNWLMTND